MQHNRAESENMMLEFRFLRNIKFQPVTTQNFWIRMCGISLRSNRSDVEMLYRIN